MLEKIIIQFQKKQGPAYLIHNDFFRDMDEIETILHSFGFGFADVDMFYIEEIASHVNLDKVIWYLNTFDSHNIEIIENWKNSDFILKWIAVGK